MTKTFVDLYIELLINNREEILIMQNFVEVKNVRYSYLIYQINVLVDVVLIMCS